MQAINDDLRQKIMLYLHRYHRVNVTEVYTQLRLEQSIASMNLAKLRRCGIVIAEREDKIIYYSLDYKRLDKIQKAIDLLREK